MNIDGKGQRFNKYKKNKMIMTGLENLEQMRHQRRIEYRKDYLKKIRRMKGAQNGTGR